MAAYGRSERGRENRRARERSVDDAVALGEFAELDELILIRVGVELKRESDRRETHRRFSVHSEPAAEAPRVRCAR